jgi:autotransporter family porin
MTNGTNAARRSALVAAVAALVAVIVTVQVKRQADPPAPGGPSLSRGPVLQVPRGGYFELRSTGTYSALPSDAAAARMVHRSPIEVRPKNVRFNRTVPPRLRLQPVDPAAHAYDPRWNRYVLGRVTGKFTGTTDEILQWVAAKWGLPDDLVRTIAFLESTWNQTNFGDYETDRRKCPPGYTRLPCPVTFGIVGTKSTSWPGVFPWNRDSTAAAADVLGAWLRGCYEGWVWWLRDHGNRSRGVYAAGDIWGCVGAWYSGDWHDGSPASRSGEGYIANAKRAYAEKPWLRPGF